MRAVKRSLSNFCKRKKFHQRPNASCILSVRKSQNHIYYMKGSKRKSKKRKRKKKNGNSKNCSLKNGKSGEVSEVMST